MNLIILPKSNELLDIAFRKARKEAAMLKSERNRIKDAKGKNIKRIEVSGNYVMDVLHNASEGFPSMQKVHPFYRELIETTIDVEAMLHALGHFSAERRIIARIKQRSIGRINGLRKTEAKKAGAIATEFYGRLSSLAKKLDSSIEKYNAAARQMRELPSVSFELKTAIIAGYPNTGKSTLLGRMTKSKPKTASYPFTTQKLQIGYLIHNYESFQLIDTPGLLDRPIEKRNTIERKAIAALRHLANAIIFVVDPTMRCGFEIEKQAGLFGEIKKEFSEKPLLVVLNKADIASNEEMQKAKLLFPEAIIEGEGIESKLHAEIVKRMEKKNHGKTGQQ